MELGVDSLQEIFPSLLINLDKEVSERDSKGKEDKVILEVLINRVKEGIVILNRVDLWHGEGVLGVGYCGRSGVLQWGELELNDREQGGDKIILRKKRQRCFK